MGRVKRALVVLTGWILGCATASPSPADTPARSSVPISSTEDLIGLALSGSGFEQTAARKNARAKLQRLIKPLVLRLKTIPREYDRGRQLLEALHEEGGLLGQYDARASTLEDVLSRRRYNCVSASVLYNLVADRVELNVGAELLPTHARSLLSVRVGDRLQKVVVETTSPHGFDPDIKQMQKILQSVAGPRVKGARTIVSEQGEIVSSRVLVATMYINRASIAQETGDLAAAERLFEQGELFAEEAGMRQVLRDQRAAILAQLAVADMLSQQPDRIARAYQNLKVAAKLDPQHPETRDAVFQNLRAAAERMIHHESKQGQENALLTLAGEAASFSLSSADRSGLRAFALSEIGRIRIENGNFDKAVEAIEQALAEQLGPDDVRLQAMLLKNRFLALQRAARTAAEDGDYKRSQKYLERLERLGSLTSDELNEVKQERLRTIQLVGNRRINQSNFEGAAEVYRDGLRRFPKHGALRNNLMLVLQKASLPLVQQARCADVEPYLEELTVLDSSHEFPAKARVECLLKRARQRLEGGDFAEAVSLIQDAEAILPKYWVTRQNKAVALLRWIEKLVQQKQCTDARKKARKLKRLELPKFGPRAVNQILGPCRS